MLIWALIVSCVAGLASVLAFWYARAALSGVAVSAPSVLAAGQKLLEASHAEISGAFEALKIDSERSLGTHNAQIARAFDELKAELIGKADSQDAKLTTWRVDIVELLDAVEGMLDNTERKRRSTAQIARRMQPEVEAEPVALDPFTMDRDQLAQLARNKGLM